MVPVINQNIGENEELRQYSVRCENCSKITKTYYKNILFVSSWLELG